MKLLIFSDSHGNMNNMIRAISRHGDIDMILHLGDCVGDALKLRKLYPGICLEFYMGNNDWNSGYPCEKVLEIVDKKILITHGHLYNVKHDYKRMVSKGHMLGVDAIFFGHTHRADEVFCSDLQVLNPGSIGGPGYAEKPGYCLAEVINSRMITKFYSV